MLNAAALTNANWNAIVKYLNRLQISLKGYRALKKEETQLDRTSLFCMLYHLVVPDTLYLFLQ